MPNPSAEAIWNLNDAQLKALLDSGSLKPQSGGVRFYAPSFTYYKTKHYSSTTAEFPTISVTGNSCALNCKHCGGKVLETMHPALSAEQLWQTGLALKAKGAKGVLVSGGCLPDGSVPLEGFADALFRFKHELALTVFVHTAITSPQTAAALKKADVDAALIDVIGSDQTIKKVLNLNVTAQDYAQSLRALANADLNVVPHVIVGLNDGVLDGELQALQTINQTVKPSAVVIIAFMPLYGTQMQKTPPPRPLDIAKVAAAARLMFPKTPLALGCMRPKGKLRGQTDLLALKA
ncbi:MAG: radical SAM protein, partial [Chloroflexi bacterium]|nr:radical SAM protein [Chloroflexota bacterium]